LVSLLGNATTAVLSLNIDKFKRLNLIYNNINFESVKDMTEVIKVAITGALSIKRADFEKVLIDNGFALGDIVRGTAYLITNDTTSGSSKNVKADKLGIVKITEVDFLNKFNIKL